MFTVIFHDEAEKEFTALPAAIRAKMARLLMKLEANPRQLREPDTKPLGNGLFEIRTMGAEYRPRNLEYIRVVNVFFYFGSLSKNRQKRPRQK